MDALTRRRLRLDPLEVDVAAVPAEGETVCGDGFCALSPPGGVLLAVADGLGHGPEAAEAAQLACASLEHGPGTSSLVTLVEHCHERLRRSRGAVVALAFFPRGEGRLDWLAVGNVEGLLLHADGARREALIQRPGIVGRKLPPLRSSSAEILPGDTLVLATDGIGPGLAGELEADPSALDDAGRLVSRFGTRSDDALVLIARYLGWDG
jgi:negative regulator of sigma-B (phosphoserine phosphatase)